MTDLASLLLEMLNTFEETEGREPSREEVRQIRCDSILILEVEAAALLEDREYLSMATRIKWNEA